MEEVRNHKHHNPSLHPPTQPSLHPPTLVGSNNVPLGATPDSFQGYGRVTLSNVLPLKGVLLDTLTS
jgi:hypothetical protein